jgi:RND family efflux transporter MFP subunit
MKTVKNLWIFLLAALLSACAQRETPKDVVPPVKVDTVRIYGERQKVTFPGKIKATMEVNLSFKVAGPVAGMYADEGKHVTRGQVIAEIDARDYKVQLSATEAEYKSVKAEAERVMELYGKESVSQNDYDKAVYGLKQITAKYDAHKNALADTKLLAPFDGYIQKHFFNAGETVGAGMPVVSMIDAGAPEVEINIPASEYIKRQQFDSFSCTVDIYPGEVFPLDLMGITKKANINQLYTMRLKLRSGAAPMPSPGMTAMVDIRYRPENTAYTSIPGTALFENDSTAAVWIYDSGTQTVSSRTVRTHAFLNTGTVIVREGLSAGEIVVSAGVHALKEGQKVSVLPPFSSTNKGKLL